MPCCFPSPRLNSLPPPATCSDGANDTCALRAAAVGVSLCEAEASVAAPLTSKRQTVACMLDVVAEGRASLATSYVVFQFIICYAFVQGGRGACRQWRGCCGCGARGQQQWGG